MPISVISYLMSEWADNTLSPFRKIPSLMPSIHTTPTYLSYHESNNKALNGLSIDPVGGCTFSITVGNTLSMFIPDFADI